MAIVALAGLSTGIGLLAGEILLRMALPSTYYVWPPHLAKAFEPRPGIMPGVSGRATFRTNAQGIRGDELEPSNTYRILTIGGSSTESLFLDQEETWSSRLQAALNTRTNHDVWVGNAGRSGTTTRHHVTAMELLPLGEMGIDAVVFLIGVNDLGVRLARDSLYDPRWRTREAVRDTLAKAMFTGGGHPTPDAPWFKRTALWRTMGSAARLALRSRMTLNVQDEQGQVYATWRTYRAQAQDIVHELPDLSSALEEYAQNVHRMIDVAESRGVRPVFVTHPSLWQAAMPDELTALLWLGGIGAFQREPGNPYYSSGALDEGMRRYNAVLRQVCVDRGVECIDLAPELAKDTSVFYDDVHFNEAGSEQVAEVVSRHLLGRQPFASVVQGGSPDVNAPPPTERD